MNGLNLLGAFLAMFFTVPLANTVDAQSNTVDLDKELFLSPQAGGVRRWEVSHVAGIVLRSSPDGDRIAGANVPTRAIVTNFGCADHVGELWCNVRRLHGGPRGYALADDLSPVVGPDGVTATGINDSAKRAKRKTFNATSEIPCAQERGQALGLCRLGVARSDGGDATVAVTFANGFSRYLYFMHGEFVSASATMSGAGRDTDWTLKEGVHYIRADDQRFEIPHTVLFGAN